MSYIQPDSEIWLCKDVPLDPSYDNQLTFTSGTGVNRTWDSTKQQTYFASKAVAHPQNFSIVKERDGVLRLAGDVGDFYDINYMFFTNSNFSNKLFYAFVTRVEYLNPNTTLMYFELDEFQTWASELIFKESSIEREHVEHDEMYANLEDEGMPISERIPYAVEYFDACLGEKQLVIGATERKGSVISKLRKGGFEIPYDYMSFAPNLNLPTDRYYEVENISDLECYDGNNNSLYFESYYYDIENKKIIIKGIEDATVELIYFTINTKYHYRETDIFPKRSVDNVKFAMYGSLNQDTWIFGLNGEVVPYYPWVDYPDFDFINKIELDIAVLRVKVGTSWLPSDFTALISTAMNKHINTDDAHRASFIQIKGESGLTEIQIGIKTLSFPSGWSNTYYVNGVYTSGEGWTFSALNGG